MCVLGGGGLFGVVLGQEFQCVGHCVSDIGRVVRAAVEREGSMIDGYGTERRDWLAARVNACVYTLCFTHYIVDTYMSTGI